MPLYSYKCDKCDAETIEMLLPMPVNGMKCSYCDGGTLIRKYKPPQIRYGKLKVAAIEAKGRVVPATGKLVKDTFEYEKELRRAGCDAISTREYEQKRSLDNLHKQQEVRVCTEKAKKEILSNPNLLSKEACERKRKEIRGAV